MRKSIFFVIGTDTSVGKTVLADLLTQRLRERNIRVAALKPLCSGGRGDARALRRAAGNVLTLDEVNPWSFRAPLAPLLAARMEEKHVRLREVIKHIRDVQKKFDAIVVEGAGGLLSPLGENFDARDCLSALPATPILVCPNQLGAINQVLLVCNALPKDIAEKMQIVLMAPPLADLASRSNLKLLAEFISPSRVHLLPRLRPSKDGNVWHVDQRIRKVLDDLLDA